MANSLTSDGVISTGTPAFCIKMHTGQNTPAHGETLAWNNSGERFDQGSDFASYTFTAPVTGKYVFLVYFRVNTADHDNNYIYFNINTSNNSYEMDLAGTSHWDGDGQYVPKHGMVLADMDASDTCFVLFHFSGGATCSSLSSDSWFSGYLAC